MIIAVMVLLTYTIQVTDLFVFVCLFVLFFCARAYCFNKNSYVPVDQHAIWLHHPCLVLHRGGHHLLGLVGANDGESGKAPEIGDRLPVVRRLVDGLLGLRSPASGRVHVAHRRHFRFPACCYHTLHRRLTRQVGRWEYEGRKGRKEGRKEESKKERKKERKKKRKKERKKEKEKQKETKKQRNKYRGGT